MGKGKSKMPDVPVSSPVTEPSTESVQSPSDVLPETPTENPPETPTAETPAYELWQGPCSLPEGGLCHNAGCWDFVYPDDGERIKVSHCKHTGV